MQNFLNAAQNYPELKGQQTNLFKCFLPQAWKYGTTRGVSAFIHPDGVFDDPKGGYFREIMYPKLRKHFQFTNELKLFSEVHHNTVFSLNVYCNEKNSKFEMIAVDELHTFDGAQGTDLACLLRRLKRRLGIYDGYLCCVGTSATMGSKENNSSILSYAEEIFGEPFDKSAIITEDRLSAQEFFANVDATEFSMPTRFQVSNARLLLMKVGVSRDSE